MCSEYTIHGAELNNIVERKIERICWISTLKYTLNIIVSMVYIYMCTVMLFSSRVIKFIL